MSILKTTISTNNKIRELYNSPTERRLNRIFTLKETLKDIVSPSGGIGRHKGLKIPRYLSLLQPKKIIIN